MKIKDFATLSTHSVNPQSKPQNVWHLYSLPSFDDGKKYEEVLGCEIMSNKYKVPAKCILFNKLNVRFKRIWAITSATENDICSTEFLPLIIDETKADFNFAYHLFHSDFITNYLTGQNRNTSGSHKRIEPADFLNIEVELPPIQEQKRIGRILSSLEEKIEINEQINRNLEDLAREIYDYWFVQFDFPDKNGKPYKSSGGKMVWNEQLKNEIPESWNAKKIKNIAKVYNGATPSTKDSTNYDGDVIWITPKDLSDQSAKFVYKGVRNITKKGFDSCSTKILSQGTILMSSRAPIGLLSIAACELCTNQGFKNLETLDKELRYYLYYVIKTHIPQIQNLGTGTTFKEVSKDSLENFEICVPPESIVKLFNSKVQFIFEKQLLLQKETEKLNELRDFLLPLLMNGQVKVG